MATEMEQINLKLDRILVLLETKKKEWTIENFTEHTFLIKFPYNVNFINHAKENGGTWMLAKKGWVFPLKFEQEIISSICSKFPLWTAKDTREE